MRGCTVANLSQPSVVSSPANNNSGFDSYHLVHVAPQPTAVAALAAGYTFSLSDVGFAFNTRVAVRDVFAKAELGVHVGTYATTRSIPLHGVLLLWLSYSPQYPPHRGEL